MRSCLVFGLPLVARKCGTQMSFTSQLGGPNLRPLWPLTLLLLCAVACTRPGTPTDQSVLESDHPAPFRPDGASTDSVSSENRETPGNNLPFHDSQSLPAGTLLTVRLSNPVYAETSIASSSFEALVVEPVVVEGNVIVPRGALVSGLVESVRASQVKPSRGYVRLTLQSIQIGDSEIPLHTASLFAPQTSFRNAAPSLVRLEKGRQLTFRLAEPAYTSNQRAKLTH
jgi:hypothetical protein